MHADSASTCAGPGSHYCENLGRAHKSNHVYFVLNFVQGVCCQKCYDPDCTSFRSALATSPPLPPSHHLMQNLCLPLELCNSQHHLWIPD